MTPMSHCARCSMHSTAARLVHAGNDPAAVDKQYTVRSAAGSEFPLFMSQMTRKLASLTKSGLKAWLHTVARQQSLGKRGLPGIWLVNSEVMQRYGIDDSLPADIAAHVQLSVQRREKRNSRPAGASSGALPAPAAGAAAVGPNKGKTGLTAVLARPQAAAAAGAGGAGPVAIGGSPGGMPGQNSVAMSPAAEKLQQLAAQGASEAALQQAALEMRLSAISQTDEAAAATHDSVNAMPAHTPAPPTETVEQSEARLARDAPPLKQAIFAVLKDAGPDGLPVNLIIDRLAPKGFVWDAEGSRGAKSSIASTCSHDGAFLRLSAGVFALRALPGALERVDASTAGCSREVLEVCLCTILFTVQVLCRYQYDHACCVTRFGCPEVISRCRSCGSRCVTCMQRKGRAGCITYENIARLVASTAV